VIKNKRLARKFSGSAKCLGLSAAVAMIFLGLIGSGFYPGVTSAKARQGEDMTLKLADARGMAGRQRPEMDGVAIPMRDSKNLIADVWLPAKTGKFPTILMITPYNRKLLGASLPDPAFADGLLDREHYAYVIVDWRGFHGSAAAKVSALRMLIKHEDRLTQLGEDGYDTVEWIARQPWSNGKVGMWGPSALGRIQYFTAATRPPHLVCAVPAVSSYGYEYDLYYYGGVLKQGYLDILGRVGYGFQKKVLEHPSNDQFWQYLASLSHFNRIDIPMFVVSGWYDLYPEGALNAFDKLRRLGGPRARQGTKMLIGPWHHTAVGQRTQGGLDFPQAENIYTAETRQFFDFWLRDEKNNGWEQRQPVRYFQMGINEWKAASTFPPLTASESVYYLDDGKRLTSKKPAIARSSASFRYDPSNPSPTVGGMNAYLLKDPKTSAIGAGPRDQRPRVESRNDDLIYTSEVLNSAINWVGYAKVKLFVSSDREDTDFAIRLCDVYPDGRAMLITDGIRRMRYRNSVSHAELMVPGKIYPVTVTLSPTAYTFLKGHRIQIIITSSNYPRFAVNPNIGHKKLFTGHSLVAVNTVYQDPIHASALMLPAGQ
jgi:hypothetical protein